MSGDPQITKGKNPESEKKDPKKQKDSDKYEKLNIKDLDKNTKSIDIYHHHFHKGKAALARGVTFSKFKKAVKYPKRNGNFKEVHQDEYFSQPHFANMKGQNILPRNNDYHPQNQYQTQYPSYVNTNYPQYVMYQQNFQNPLPHFYINQPCNFEQFKNLFKEIK